MATHHRIAALAATGLLALLAPAAALAHPSVYSTTALLAKTQEVQTITIAGATTGSFQPSAAASSVPFNATALQVQLALEQDPAIGVGNIDVSGSAGGPYTLRWVGAKNQTNEAQVAPVQGSLDVAPVAATTTNGGTAISFGTDSTGATLPQQQFYVIAEHGYSPLLKETNGSNEGGMLNLKRLPGTYRGTPMTAADWLSFAAAQTDVQAHPVCEGVAALQNPTNILNANEDPTQPFWNYVPFTKTAAGIADDPVAWTDVLQTVLGGSYATTNTVAEFQSACAGLGGVYRPADAAGAASPIYSAALSDATTPLNSQITTLTSEKTALTSDKSSLQATITTLNATIDDLKAKVAAADALTIAPASKRLRVGDATMLVTGAAGTKVTVTVTVTKTVSTKLKLSGTTLGTGRVTIGANGAAIAEPSFGKAIRTALAGSSTAVTITATGGGATATAKATLLG